MYLLQSCCCSFNLIIFTNNVPSRIIQLMTYINEFNSRGIPINIDECPKGPSRFNSTKEDALLFAIDTEVNITRRRDIVKEDGILATKALRKGLGPVAWFICQVGTSVLRKAISKTVRVVICVTKADYAAPVVGDFQELNTNLKKRTVVLLQSLYKEMLMQQQRETR